MPKCEMLAQVSPPRQRYFLSNVKFGMYCLGSSSLLVQGLVLTRGESGVLWPDDYVPATGDDRNQKSNQGCLGDISQVQAGTDIKKLHDQTSTQAIRRSDNSDYMLRIGKMDTHQRARKNDTVDATQNAPTHHANEKKIEKNVKHKDKTNEEKDTDDLSSTGDESEDGQSSNTHKDQDSDVSFENDTEEEIDTTDTEEEDWIDFIKRSTNDAIEKMGNAKIRC